MSKRAESNRDKYHVQVTCEVETSEKLYWYKKGSEVHFRKHDVT